MKFPIVISNEKELARITKARKQFRRDFNARKRIHKNEEGEFHDIYMAQQKFMIEEFSSAIKAYREQK